MRYAAAARAVMSMDGALTHLDMLPDVALLEREHTKTVCMCIMCHNHCAAFGARLPTSMSQVSAMRKDADAELASVMTTTFALLADDRPSLDGTKLAVLEGQLKSARAALSKLQRLR